MTIDPATGLVAWTPAAGQAGDRAVTLLVSDGRGGTATQSFTLTTVAASANRPPEIASHPPVVVALGSAYFYQVDAADPDGDPLGYRLDAGPAGMTVGPDGAVRWVPSAGLVGTTQPVTVRVSDGRGGVATQPFSLQVVAQASNSPPAIVSAPPLSGRVGFAYAYDVRATDPDNDAVRYGLDRAPRGVSLDPVLGTVRWTPAAGQEGPQEVVVRATDAFFASATQSFVIQVRPLNTPPVITSAPPTQAAAGQPYLFAVRATDVDGDALGYRLVAGPAGMQVDTATGVVRWVPTAAQAGDRTVRLAVDDGRGGTATQAYVVRVGTPADLPPVITSAPALAAVPGRPYAYDVEASDPEGLPVTYALEQAPAGMTIDPATGLVAWTPTEAQAGPHAVTVVARDPAGGVAAQSFVVVAAANRAPAITSAPVTAVTAGNAYRYDVRAADPEGDALAYAVAGPDGMAIDGFGRITWATGVPGVGAYPVVVTVTDPYGASARQAFTLSVRADTSAPRVSLVASAGLVDKGNTVVYQVRASDDVGVTALALRVGGVLVPLDGQGQAVVTMNTAGLIDAVATAADAAGNVGTSATVRVLVRDPDDVNAPHVEILSPAMDQTVTYLTDVVGTVTDDNLASWRLEYARADLVDLDSFGADDEDYVVLARGTTNVTAGTLAAFDPTVLSNDTYVLRLFAEDAGGLGTARGVLVHISGQAKLGNLHLEFTDLQLPLAGIPITLTRVYDTLDARSEGDFGFGWHLGVQDAHIRESVPQVPDGLFSSGAPFSIGTRVYLTDPEGKRVGFTFEPVVGGISPFFGVYWLPKFRADPGVYDKLDVDNVALQQRPDGTFAVFLFSFLAYNPDAYRLTTPDGTAYRYDQFAGLQQITDRSGNTVTFTDTAITHSRQGSVQLVRDPQGRIVRVVGPARVDGEDPVTLRYDYDARGDLVAFTNAAGETTRYTYLATPAHFLDTVTDPRGVTVFDAAFDAEGRLTSSTDALGATSTQAFDPEQFQGTVTDARGNVTLLRYDDRGNVVEKTEPNLADPAHPYVTAYEYADPRNPDKETRVTDPRGVVEEKQYDASGNLTEDTRAAGTTEQATTFYTYSARNEVTTVRQEGRPPAVFQYDASGHVTGTLNALGDAAQATYDSQGRVATFTDFNGNATTYDYHDGCACGSPHTVTYADGAYEVFDYNRFGQVTRDAKYEANGTLAEVRTTNYDRQGRVIEEAQGEGADRMVLRKVYTGGLLDYEVLVNPLSPNDTPDTPLSQRLSRVTDYEYDAAGRLVRQTDGEGGVTTFHYDADGNRVFLKDPVGNVTTWNYDAQNRVVEERDPFYWVGMTDAEILAAITVPSGADPSRNLGAPHVTAYADDGMGNRTKVIDRNGRRREFDHDLLGRATQERWYDPNGTLVRTITSTYNLYGNLLTAADPDSHYAYTYDALNRVTSADNADTPGVPHVVLAYA